jgi:hypothetical protein
MMRFAINQYFLPISFFFLCFCSKGRDIAMDPPFRKAISKPLHFFITEASGITHSTTQPGNFWVQEDSGNPSQLYLINNNGELIHKSYVKNATNRDWEDIAIAGNQLFIADIGDNSLIYPDYTVYSFTEPAVPADTISTTKAIRFKYPDGAHDAEALLVDPSSKDIFIITKRDNPSKVYKLVYPYSQAMNVAITAGTLNYSSVTAAALSPDGKEVIIKTYTDLYYYTKNSNEAINETLQKAYLKIPYTLEPQGEAISFASDNSGFYTLSEQILNNPVSLYFYQRK